MRQLSKKQKKLIILSSIIILLASLFIVYLILSLTYEYDGETNLYPKALNPVFLDLGKLEIRWYAVCIVGGASLLSVFGYYRYLKPLKMDSDTVFTMVTFGILFGILGGRIYYVIFNHSFISFGDGSFKDILNGLIDIINPASGGLAIHGAIYMVLIYLFIDCRRRRLHFINIIEIMLPVFMLAQVVGRWGNFFNQEAYGPLVNGYKEGPLSAEQLIAQRETLRHFLVPDFIINNMYIKHGVKIIGYYHPTFFYEGVLNLIGAVTYLIVRKKSNKIYMGDGICFYLTWYGIVRLFIEILRQDPLTFNLFGMTIKVAILTSVIFIIVGITLFILRRVFKFHLVSAKEYIYNGGSLWLDGENPYLKEKEKNDEYTSSCELNENKVVFFDCDGTILDTFKLIEETTKRVFEEMLPDYQYTIDEIHAFFGPLLEDSFKKYAKDEEQVKQLVDRYRVLNIELHEEYIKSFDGVEELLKKLQEDGYYVVIVSHKVTSVIIQGLQICGLYEYIDEIIGVEKLAKPKPNPETIYELMEAFNVDKAMFVGDTKFDILTANNVKGKYPNFKSVGVTWCKTSRGEFEELNADYICDTAMEVYKVIKEYNEV